MQNDAQDWRVRREKPAQPFRRRLLRAMVLMIIAVVAHVWGVRAPRSREAAPPAASLSTTVSQTVVRDTGKQQPAPVNRDAPPAVRVVTTDLVAVSTTGLVQGESNGRHEKPRAEPKSVGTSGRIEAVAPASAVVSESAPAHQNSSPEPDALAAAVDHGPTTTADMPLHLVPLSASRSLPTAPQRIARPAPERIINAAPIVEPDRALVVGVLQRYADAYERLDVDATKAVYPSVNHVALKRAFNQLETQRLTFESCGITISGRDANARCQGEAAYRPRIGPRTLHRASREWTFDLAKADEGWQIVKATVR